MPEPRTVFQLHRGNLEWRAGDGTGSESRPLEDADHERIREWIQRYQRLLEKSRPEPELLNLGHDMAGWLEVEGRRWLTRAREVAVGPPWIVEFAVPARPDDAALHFLHAPWELLADVDGHLAAQGDLLYAPVRRIGKPGKPLAPSEFRLSTVFMAAAPRGTSELAYEEEETAILDATGRVGMDLTVEESGTLDQLVECIAELRGTEGGAERLDVLHLSCHGQAEPKPILILEDEAGGKAPVGVEQLTRRLASNLPRLLMLSACETGAASQRASDAFTGSLAATMIRHNAPAVLGWGGSVSDRGATHYAAQLYAGLARHGSLEDVVARARLELLQPMDGAGRQPSRDWHLARLYLGPRGGGIVTGGRRARWPRGREYAHKAFLDVRGKRVPVASPKEFAGRRRQVQEVLRELRRNDAERPAGVLIHGLGRLGKSSLAARIVQRLGGSSVGFAVGVVFERYNSPAIVASVASAVGSSGAEEWRRRWLPEVEQDVGRLETALVEILEGECQQAVPADSDRPARRPLLLVVDDLEQILEPVSAGPAQVEPSQLAAMRSLLGAFRHAATESRLLLTSRYRFTVPPEHGGGDLATELFRLPLSSMRPFESQKQMRAKLGLVADGTVRVDARMARVVDEAGGHPGLQDLLVTLAEKDAEACDRALAEIKAYRAGGDEPSEQELLDFLQNLVLGELLDLLTSNEHDLLRSSTLFQVPVPRAVLTAMAEELGLGNGAEAGRRLIDFGLWEVHGREDSERDIALPMLVRPRLEPLKHAEEATLAGVVIEKLFACWGGSEGGPQRSFAADRELARLALLADHAGALAASSADVVQGLSSQFLYREAVALGREAVDALDRLETAVPPRLLRLTGEMCQSTGDVAGARELLLRVSRDWEEDGDKIDVSERAAALRAQADVLRHTGEIDAALRNLERAKELLTVEGFERERAITLGQIADIYQARGELDDALRIRQEEELPVYEKLGDKSAKARALWQIARVDVQREDYQSAVDRLSESYAINRYLGRLDGISMVGLDLGQLLCAVGSVEEGRKVLLRSRQGFEKLGLTQLAQQVGEILKQLPVLEPDKGEEP